MDKLAKGAAIGVVALGTVTASILTYALLSSVQQPRVRMGYSVPAFQAAIRLPEAPLTAAMTETKPAEAAPASPAAVAQKIDLAGAFGAALGVERPKSPEQSTAPRPPAAAPSSEGLELDFATPARDSKLGERDAKSFGVRQYGGAERQRKAEKTEGERISFEMDLAQP